MLPGIEVEFGRAPNVDVDVGLPSADVRFFFTLLIAGSGAELDVLLVLVPDKLLLANGSYFRHCSVLSQFSK